MSFNFEKLALPPPPLNNRFKIRFKSFFESMPVQKTVSEVLKRGIFHILRFVRYADEGAIAPIAPSFGYATDYSTIEALNLVCIVLLCHKPKWENKLDIQLCYMIRLRKSMSARFLYNSNNRLPCKNWCILCDSIRSLRDPQFGKPWCSAYSLLLCGVLRQTTRKSRGLKRHQTLRYIQSNNNSASLASVTSVGT